MNKFFRTTIDSRNAGVVVRSEQVGGPSGYLTLAVDLLVRKHEDQAGCYAVKVTNERGFAPLTSQLKMLARNIAPGSRESSRGRMRLQKQKQWQTYQWPFKWILLRHNLPFKPEGGAILPAA